MNVVLYCSEPSFDTPDRLLVSGARRATPLVLQRRQSVAAIRSYRDTHPFVPRGECHNAPARPQPVPRRPGALPAAVGGGAFLPVLQPRRARGAPSGPRRGLPLLRGALLGPQCVWPVRPVCCPGLPGSPWVSLVSLPRPPLLVAGEEGWVKRHHDAAKPLAITPLQMYRVVRGRYRGGR
jgi:hypothetical protein